MADQPLSLGTTWTPDEEFIDPANIPKYAAERFPTTFQGCSQINQVFLKANGKITCSCMRYYHVLEDATKVNVAEWYNGKMMNYIRDSFKSGKEPFRFCEGCVSRTSSVDVDHRKKFVSLHIEPSSQCNLFCSACICATERLSDNPPPRKNLSLSTFSKMLNEFAQSKLRIDSIAFVGFGEPLFNSDLPEMAKLSRYLFPKALIYVDTNCNFGTRRAREIANCGLSKIRLSLDGVTQQAYVEYRRSGNFDKAFEFAKTLAEEVRKTRSPTKLIWKYILFRHNDTNDEIIKAIELAAQIGVEIVFDATYGDLASKRDMNEIRAIAASVGRTSSNLDPTSSNLDPVTMGGDDRHIKTAPRPVPLARKIWVEIVRQADKAAALLTRR
jgi:molybdenum cofactor biosynthesis enzyme MoaA